MSSSTAFSIASTLEKMANRDKDFRYMASSDLLTELGKDTFKIDGDAEKRLTTQLLKLLEDSSGDVQGIAVKCLGPFIKRVNEAQVGEICDQLATLLLKEKNDVRDIAALGLKLAIENANPRDGALVVKRLSQRLTTAVASETVKPETKLECLQALEDLLARFGSLMVADLEKIQAAVLPQLTSNRTAARKRATGCLARLAVATPDKLFASLIEYLIKSAKESKKSDHVRTFIQTIGAVSVAVGYRLGKYLEQIVPLIAKTIKDAGKEDESDDELRENCLQTLEALVLRCPKEVTSHVDKIVALALEYIKHDPNYQEGDEDEAEDMETDAAQDDDGEEEGDAEDDDMSWKVRRASAKVLTAVVATRPDQLPVFYDKVLPVLVARFKEREESVKCDVFATVAAVLKQTHSVTRKSASVVSAPGAKTPLTMLQLKVPSIVSGVAKQLKSAGIKTRIASFQLLKELVHVLGGGLQAQIKDLVPGLVQSLGDKSSNSNLKIETLVLVRTLLAAHQDASLQAVIQPLINPTLKAVSDPYYKISAEALRAVTEILRVLRKPGATSSFDHKPYVKPIYDACFARLKATDTDQEVKDTASTSIGLIVANLGDELSAAQLKECLAVLVERLSNEITRLTIVKVIGNIASSPLKINLVPVIPDILKELSSFFRKQNRQLKLASLTTLEIIMRQYGSDKTLGPLFPAVLTELAPLVSDADLHITQLALQLCASAIKSHPESIAVVRDTIYTRCVELVQSSLLQGQALQALLNLFGELANAKDKKLTFDSMVDSLLGLAKKPNLPKQCFSSIAQSVAALAAQAEPAKRDALVQRFAKDVQTKSDDAAQHLALLCIGEIGRRSNLEKADSLQSIILSAFESPQEEVKSAASFALGNVALGNLAKFLPFILAEVKAQPKRQYLLLHSLREIISRTSSSAGGKELVPHLASVLPLLYENTESEEEGTRNVVAECIGKLAFVNPETLLPELKTRLSSPSPRARSTFVSSLKFAIVEQPAAADTHIVAVISDFLALIGDADLDVRRSALLTLNWAAHNKPGLVREVLPKHLPALYNELRLKPELIKEVDLGPFKHKVDEGLENRKAAFEALSTILDTLTDRLDVAGFIAQLVEGLKDPSYDIKMLCHLMVVRLAHVAGAQLLESLDVLVEPLRATVTSKAAQTAVKQEIERNDELVRSALRSVHAISRIEAVETCAKFDEFLRTNVKTGELAERWEAIVKTAAESEATAMETN